MDDWLKERLEAVQIAFRTTSEEAAQLRKATALEMENLRRIRDEIAKIREAAAETRTAIQTIRSRL